MEDTFDFMINDENEVMLLIYERAAKVSSPYIEINPHDCTALLHRSDEDEIFMREVPSEVIENLYNADTLLVCELSREDDTSQTSIVKAYEADINL
ncbi:MAG: hypothetical protein IJ689_05975 [Alphaproteobacteria bacterium]|nr:hypothetical protein [Alphaproteobacteria bacterium]